LVQEILTMVTAKRSAAEVTAALVTMQNTEGDKKAVAQKALRIAAEKLGIEVAEDATNASLREAIASKLGLDTS
jgi:ribosomal protein L16/L10AE